METFLEFFQSYDYIDVFVMIMSLICTHLMVKKNRYAFIFGMMAAIGFGIIMFQAKSGAILIGEIIWFYQNLNGWKEWKEKEE